MAKKKTELDKLDIEEIIDEIKEEDVEEEVLEKDIEEEKKEEKSSEEKEEKEKKPSFLKNKKIIFLTIWIILGITSIIFAYLAYKEKTKIIHVYSIHILINHEVIYLSKEKKQQAEKEKLYHKYNFNFLFAYEFNGVNSKRILSTQVTCILKTKYEVDLSQLYAYIKSNIIKELKKLTDGKFLEEIPDYEKKISLIIQNNIINAILKVCPDLKKEDIMKTFNFVVFTIR